MMQLDRLPLFFVLNVAAFTAFLFFSFRPASQSGFSRWSERFFGWLFRLPGLRRWSQRRQEERYVPAVSPGSGLQGRLALGLGLASYFETQASLDQMLLNQIGWLRRELFLDSGMVIPSITVVQERALNPFEYALSFGPRELARGSILPAHWLVSLEGSPDWLEGRELARHPVTGRNTCWVTAAELAQALPSASRCEDGLEVFAHHLRHALWQDMASFVCAEFCQHYVAQGLERSPQVRHCRRVLESNQNRLMSLLQLVLAMGGSLRDPGKVLAIAGSGLLRGEPLETLARRIVEVNPRGSGRDQAPPSGLSSALLYSYFWNEHLSGDLLGRSDSDTLEGLAVGMLEVQSLPAPVLEQAWVETLSASEVFLLGRSSELAEQLHQMLQSKGKASRLGRSEQTAILLLSLPRQAGEVLARQVIRQLSRPKVEELIQAMGRFGYLLLQAPPGQGARQVAELGFRERIIGEFLDYACCCSLNLPVPPGEWLEDWLYQRHDLPVDELAYAVERYYFPSLEPLTRLRRAVEQDPKRLGRALVQFAQGAAAPLQAVERAPLALRSLPTELKQGVLGRLRGRGCDISEPETPDGRHVRYCQWEFAQRILAVFDGSRARSR
jgi:hypothetical protein